MHIEGVTGLNEVLGGVEAIIMISWGYIKGCILMTSWGVTAAISITSLGVNLPNYLSSGGLGKVFLNRDVSPLTVLATMHNTLVLAIFYKMIAEYNYLQ